MVIGDFLIMGIPDEKSVGGGNALNTNVLCEMESEIENLQTKKVLIYFCA